VNAQGQPERVRVVRSIASSLPPDKQRVAENLDQNAVKAVSQSQFSPANYHGKSGAGFDRCRSRL
jgi:outer membrane biosynthesis protein TonB